MANVMLSEKEFLLWQNADFILTKNSIIHKIQTSLGQVSAAYQKAAMQLPTEFCAISPKIAKGENYKGLPWLMLDYPRLFGKEDILAIRSFCWWGNCFSIHLHMKGKYLPIFAPAALQNLRDEWKINTSQEWEHDIDAPCYKTNNGLIYNKEMKVVRIAKKIPLQQLAIVEENFISSFKEILAVLVAKTVK